jgi:protein required for attachment to host cells
MMSVITWVLAADGMRARIFETRGLRLDLQQVADLKNPSQRGTESEAVFARSVAEFLETCRVDQRFDRLRLAVEARFLALLREQLSHETRKLVYEGPGEAAPPQHATIRR